MVNINCGNIIEESALPGMPNGKYMGLILDTRTGATQPAARNAKCTTTTRGHLSWTLQVRVPRETRCILSALHRDCVTQHHITRILPKYLFQAHGCKQGAPIATLKPQPTAQAINNSQQNHKKVRPPHESKLVQKRQSSREVLNHSTLAYNDLPIFSDLENTRMLYPAYDNQNSPRFSQLAASKLGTAHDMHSGTAFSNMPDHALASLCVLNILEARTDVFLKDFAPSTISSWSSFSLK
ncbi:hypothetical protein F511_06717 [Dorcoceras hygrometricum]|uniref:Uncharacterized protein n=1 Tax=Dorcoceras hygrometricum TaxID=472368 RepID=A0A2Z7A7E4_9LAMI|nr:hypothetical protein F511_06717 [Dorcoceras hygrometricum]